MFRRHYRHRPSTHWGNWCAQKFVLCACGIVLALKCHRRSGHCQEMPRFIERYICECVYHDGHYYDVMVGKVVRAGYSLVQSGKPRPFHFLDGENIAVVAQNGHVFTLS